MMATGKSMALAQSSASFRPDIEGLRALAVSGVVAFHFGMTSLPGGFVGVDIFFVISGYLITRHLQQELAARGTINLWTFYARRARRLLPASLFVILATLLVGYFVLSPAEQQVYSKGALFASTYVVNLWLIRWSFDYFAADAGNNPFIHFWSLSVEEQFYLVWPALLLLFAWFRPDRRGLFLLLAAVAVVSFALCVWMTSFAQPWAFYFSAFRAWEFALGGLASMAVMEGWAKRSTFAPALGWIGLALIAAAYLLLSEEDPFPGYIALIPAAGTVMVLLGGMRESAWGPSAVLALAPMQWTGRLSYSLYLWHWPVIVYAAMLKPELTLIDRFACVALTLALSAFTYSMIENPVRRNAWLTAGAGRSLGLAALLTATGATVAYASVVLAISNLTPQQRLIAESAERPSAVRARDRGCVLDRFAVEPRSCVFGSPSSNETVVLFGDSHADHWSTPLVEIAKKENLRLVTYLKSSCPATRISLRNAVLKREYTECAQWRELAIQEILSLHPKMVVMSQFSIRYLQDESVGRSEHLARRKRWAEGMESTFQTFSDAGIDVVFIRDVPQHTRYLDKCVARALWQNRNPSVCDTPRIKATDDSVSDVETGIVSRIRGARYVDLTDLFCDETNCKSMIGGMLTFRDRHHIATSFALTLAPPLEQAIFGSAAMRQAGNQSAGRGDPASGGPKRLQ